jgi:hypothetical protein
MAYIPISKRKKSPTSSGYIPVAQRSNYGQWGTPTTVPYKPVNDWMSGIIPPSLLKEPTDMSK